MPLYYFQCTACKEFDRRIIEPEHVPGLKCRHCHGKIVRQPRPPSSFVKNHIDNGLMVKFLENFDDCQAITHERSHQDFSRPDWQQKKDE